MNSQIERGDVPADCMIERDDRAISFCEVIAALGKVYQQAPDAIDEAMMQIVELPSMSMWQSKSKLPNHDDEVLAEVSNIDSRYKNKFVRVRRTNEYMWRNVIRWTEIQTTQGAG